MVVHVNIFFCRPHLHMRINMWLLILPTDSVIDLVIPTWLHVNAFVSTRIQICRTLTCSNVSVHIIHDNKNCIFSSTSVLRIIECSY